MATLGAMDMNIAPVVRNSVTLSVRVHGVQRFQYRTRLAKYWCMLGAWIIGCQFRIDGGGATVGVIGASEREEFT